MTPPTLEQLTLHAQALPSLPEVVNYLIRALNDEAANLETLAQHINSDPAIVARLLAAANSASAGTSKRVGSVGQAFMLLGADRIANIILASTLIHRYDTHASGFSAKLLWQHSLGVAVSARVLAEQMDMDADLAFTGGLLHDIGQLLMYTASPVYFLQALDLHHSNDMPLYLAERSVFGYDHSEAGGILATFWKLPTDIIDAIAAHHEPDGFGSDIGNLIHISEVLSHALDLGEQENNRVPEVSELACASLGLSWPKFSAHFAEVEARYDDLRIALGI